MLKIKTVLNFKLSYVVFIMLIIVKMPTIVSISRFMRMINFMLSKAEHGKSFIATGQGLVFMRLFSICYIFFYSLSLLLSPLSLLLFHITSEIDQPQQ